MSRPRYETEDDLLRERAAADAFAAQWNCEMKKADPSAPFDFFAERDGVRYAVVEIKVRESFSRARHKTLNISLSKLRRALDYASERGLSFVLGVEITGDCWAYLVVKERHLENPVHWGRNDRNDP